MGQWLSSPAQETNHVDFVTLGMVVLDEIRFPGKPPIRNVVGGSGTYSTLGARLFRPGRKCASIGFLVRAGNDFPRQTAKELQSWKTRLELREEKSHLSTRGLLIYEDDMFGSKTFRYTTEPLKLCPKDIANTPFLASNGFHILADPDTLEAQVPELMELRKAQGILTRPYIVWEPLPASCKPENREAYMHAARLVDCFSPNHLEFIHLFQSHLSDPFDQREIEFFIRQFLHGSSSGPHARCLVIRAGEHGCALAIQGRETQWMAPYYDIGNKKVVDTTGAGNAFLGGFLIGALSGSALEDALTYGTIAASFALEQIGIPRLSLISPDIEEWNGTSVMARLREYKQRHSPKRILTA